MEIDPTMGNAIPVTERLGITLRFFAAGDSFISLSNLFKTSPETVSRGVHETCIGLIEVLKQEINNCFYFYYNLSKLSLTVNKFNILTYKDFQIDKVLFLIFNFIIFLIIHVK